MDGRYPRGFVVSLLARSYVYNKTMAIIQVVWLQGVFMAYSCYMLPRKRVAGGRLTQWCRRRNSRRETVANQCGHPKMRAAAAGSKPASGTALECQAQESQWKRRDAEGCRGGRGANCSKVKTSQLEWLCCCLRRRGRAIDSAGRGTRTGSPTCRWGWGLESKRIGCGGI